MVAMRGRLIVDATAAPVGIRHSTDLSLLNECCKNLETILDHLWAVKGLGGRRTLHHRKKAWAKHLRIAKQRKPRRLQIKKAIREPIFWVRKNLNVLDGLPPEARETLGEKHLIRTEAR